MPLDQSAFQNQGLKFGLDHNYIEVVDLADHDPRFLIVPRLVLEVLADAVFQGFRLAHIDDLTAGILHDVYARLQGQGMGFLSQFVKCQPDSSPFTKKAPHKRRFFVVSVGLLRELRVDELNQSVDGSLLIGAVGNEVDGRALHNAQGQDPQ